MNYLDMLLEKKGLKYEDLNYEEREFYRKSSFDLKGLSITDLKEKILELKEAIAMDLVNTPDNKENYEKNRTLKARLQNYIVLHAFLAMPERAEKALNKAVEDKQESKI